MNNLLCFVLGVMVGGSVGVAFMCCFQLNRMNKLNEQITSLQAELNKTQQIIHPIHIPSSLLSSGPTILT